MQGEFSPIILFSFFLLTQSRRLSGIESKNFTIMFSYENIKIANMNHRKFEKNHHRIQSSKDPRSDIIAYQLELGTIITWITFLGFSVEMDTKRLHGSRMVILFRPLMTSRTPSFLGITLSQSEPVFTRKKCLCGIGVFHRRTFIHNYSITKFIHRESTQTMSKSES